MSLRAGGREGYVVASGTALLVASGGGHLHELVALLGLVEAAPRRVWVTYDTAASRSVLGCEHVIGAHHPTTRHLPNAARNYALARSVFADVRPDYVISTGAGIAVPFAIRATQLGVPFAYVESATRVKGPSLSGRMLQPLRPVDLYRQLGDWGAPRWRQGPCVFDGFSPTESWTGRYPRRVLVSLGTHAYPFPRLLDRLGPLLRSFDSVTWQLGSTPPLPALPGRKVDILADAELREELRTADVVVAHAGVGIALAALSEGKIPVLIPRRRRYGEHADDHQVEFAERLAGMGIARTAEIEALTLSDLVQAAAATATRALVTARPLFR